MKKIIILIIFFMLPIELFSEGLFIKSKYSTAGNISSGALNLLTIDKEFESSFDLDSRHSHNFRLTVGKMLYFPVSFLLSASYSNHNINFYREDSEVIGVDGEAYQALIRRSADFNLQSFGLSAGIAYCIDNWQFSSSYDIYFPFNCNYEIVDKIIEPIDRAVFEDTKQRKRFVESGDFNSFSSNVSSLSFSISYHLQINKSETLFIVPNISIHKDLNNLIAKSASNNLQYGLGISLSYYFENKPQSLKKIIRKNLNQ